MALTVDNYFMFGHLTQTGPSPVYGSLVGFVMNSPYIVNNCLTPVEATVTMPLNADTWFVYNAVTIADAIGDFYQDSVGWVTVADLVTALPTTNDFCLALQIPINVIPPAVVQTQYDYVINSQTLVIPFGDFSID